MTALADLAPSLTAAIEKAMADGITCVCLDGTLVDIDRVDVRKPDGRHLFYSGADRSSTRCSG